MRLADLDPRSIFQDVTAEIFRVGREFTGVSGRTLLELVRLQSPLESLHPGRIGVPVILATQLSEENITSTPGAAQIERNGQLGLIADSAGDPRAICDAVRTFATRYDNNGVRSGLAEARKGGRESSGSGRLALL